MPETLSNIDIQNKNEKWAPCKCPYCFKQLNAYYVGYRAETVIKEQDLEDMSEADQERFAPYVEYTDSVLKDFVTEYSAEQESDENKREYEKHAIIHPILSGENVIKSNTYLIDDDGFPYGMVDTIGRESTRKICVHCHNSLPHQYGKFPVKFIAIVGITSSGKTVYLSQLLSHIEEYLTRANLTVLGVHDELDSYVKSHMVSRDVLLPQGTAAHTLTRPLPLNVKDIQTGECYTLMFYDIAGENCAKPDQMKKFGPFIKNADGIIMIVDPYQFSNLFRLQSMNSDDMARPERVVSAMYNAFLGDMQDASQGGKSGVPLAVSLSKSDILKDYYLNKGVESHLFHPINYSQYSGRGLAYDDFRNISTEIEYELKSDESLQGETFINTISSNFERVGYFAFSSLNTTPRRDENGYSLDEIPERIRIEEPLYWILHLLGIIPRTTKSGERCGYVPCLYDNLCGGLVEKREVVKPYVGLSGSTAKDSKQRKGLFSRK